MSTLPEIDSTKVEQKLLAKLAEQIQQTVHLEALAEALRDQRDEARTQRNELSRQLDELRADKPADKEV